VSDIHLRKLQKACANVEESLDQGKLYIDFELGGRLRPGMDVVYVGSEESRNLEIPEEFRVQLAEAVYCVPEKPWLTGEDLVDRNMAQIEESTRSAVNNLNIAGLERFLGLYTDLLEYATGLNQKVADSGMTPQPISSLIGRVYRKFFKIFEAAGRTGDSELINTIRGEIFRISVLYHKQKEPYLFDKSVKLYGQYYYALVSSETDNQQLIHGVLSSFQDLKVMLTSSLRRAKSVDEVEHIASDLESFYGVLERILQEAIDQEDDQTFNNAWDLGADPLVAFHPEMDISKLEWQVENAESDEDAERLQRELDYKRSQREAVEKIESKFEETRFVASAWAYHSMTEGKLSEEVFNSMFVNSIRSRYQSFDDLAESYFDLYTQARLDLFRWSMDDSDIFKGGQFGRVATDDWLKEFFCAMGLVLLDPAEFDSADLEESDNPLANLEVERTGYPGLEEGIEWVSKEDLERLRISDEVVDSFEERKELFLALHHQMQDLLERREEDEIIEADLDPEKVSSFKEEYVEEFSDQFVLRDVFSDLGWLSVEEYDEDVDVEISGYNILFPKGALIEDPPTEYIHYLDQKARRHIEAILDSWLDDGVSEVTL
jgi:hypothetical protein